MWDITLTSLEPRWRLKSPASRLFTQTFIQTQIKENIKASRHWPLCGEFTGTGEFPAQRASYAENGCIWWRHHEMMSQWLSQEMTLIHVGLTFTVLIEFWRASSPTGWKIYRQVDEHWYTNLFTLDLIAYTTNTWRSGLQINIFNEGPWERCSCCDQFMPFTNRVHQCSIWFDCTYSISQEICTRFCCALLCCGNAIVHNEFTWSIYPYSSVLLCWHWGNR